MMASINMVLHKHMMTAKNNGGIVDGMMVGKNGLTLGTGHMLMMVACLRMVTACAGCAGTSAMCRTGHGGGLTHVLGVRGLTVQLLGTRQSRNTQGCNGIVSV